MEAIKIFDTKCEFKVELMNLKGTDDYIVVITDASDDDFRKILSGKEAEKFMSRLGKVIMQ